MAMELDQEQEDAMAAADGTNEPEAEEEAGSMALLEDLERIDRQIIATEEEKKETVKAYNGELKNLKKLRLAALDNIEGYRRGERSLPLE